MVLATVIEKVRQKKVDVDRHVLFGKLTKLGVGITFLDLLMDCYPGDCIRSKAGSAMMEVMV